MTFQLDSLPLMLSHPETNPIVVLLLLMQHYRLHDSKMKTITSFLFALAATSVSAFAPSKVCVVGVSALQVRTVDSFHASDPWSVGLLRRLYDWIHAPVSSRGCSNRKRRLSCRPDQPVSDHSLGPFCMSPQHSPTSPPHRWPRQFLLQPFMRNLFRLVFLEVVLSVGGL
jgi:hypothetical protein